MISGMKLGRNQLKWLAILTMLIDHFAYIFLFNQENWYDLGRAVGRISFPLICFVLVQGFFSTKNVWKYIVRMFILALLSEIPFDLAFSHSIFDISSQNVIFTLCMGLLVLVGMRYWENRWEMQAVCVFAGIFLSWVLHTDYNWFGIALIAIFYKTGNQKIEQFIMAGLMILMYGEKEIAAFLSFPVLFLYDAEKKERTFLRYVFYAFYPVHLLLYYMIRRFSI